MENWGLSEWLHWQEALNPKEIESHQYYRYEPEQGFHLLSKDSQIKKYSGKNIFIKKLL